MAGREPAQWRLRLAALARRARPHLQVVTPRRVAAIGLTLSICTLAGFLTGTSAALSKGTDLRGGRNTDLVSLVQTEAHQNAELAHRVSELRQEVDDLSGRPGNPVDEEQLDRAALAAQVAAVSGPGVAVVLDDAPSSVAPPDLDPDLLVVHQQDIQAVANAMWAGGAEAMAIQGQRIVSTTGIKCVGNTVVLQGIPYAPPYRIEAIGDPAAIEAALAASDYVRNYQEYVAVYGLGYQQHRRDVIALPAYAGSTELENARPGAS